MPRRSPSQERDARALDRDVGAGPHGDADIRLRQRGASLMPSPAMATIAALGLEPLDLVGLLVGQDFGADLVEPEPARDGLGRRAVVAGEHDQAEALVCAGRRSRRAPTP